MNLEFTKLSNIKVYKQKYYIEFYYKLKTSEYD